MFNFKEKNLNYLKLLAFVALSLLSFGFAYAKAPSIDYQWLEFTGSKQDCVAVATESLYGRGFTITPVGVMTIVVRNGNYKGVITCFADYGLVVFTVAGNNYKKAEQFAKQLKNFFSQFQGAMSAPTQPPGLYPQASIRPLTHNELIPLSKWQLKIMRNEIFARHGYIFKGAAMRNYFNAQPWYYPRLRDVSHLLTSIEQKNISFIQRYEK
jgi:hypothetical protein